MALSAKRRFRWMRAYMKPKAASPIRIPGLKSWKRPYCTKCGKKIRNIQKLVYVDGKPYHKKCAEVVSHGGESEEEK